MAGVTSSGFLAKTLSDLQADLQAAFRSVYGAAVNVDARARVGQFVDLLADRLTEAWELAEAAATALDPALASGVLLDNIAALTGTTRAAAFASRVSVVFIGTAGTVLAIGRRVGVTGTSTVFEGAIGGTITAAPTWAATTAFAQYAIVQAGGALWFATNAGTSSSVAPNGTGPTFVDGTITWKRLGTGTAFALIPCVATQTGPLQAFADAVTTIVTPVAGLASVTNPLDCVVGRDTETDAELRVRRAAEIGGIGSSPLEALRAEVSALAGVSNAIVFENTTDATVGTIGPHGLEVLVEGGVDTEIADAILAGKAAGIATFGSTSLTRNTSNGDPIVVKFSRPTTQDVWVTATLSKDASRYPIDGDAQVQAAIVAFGDTRALGQDVVASAIAAAIFAAVPGVLDVSEVKIGTAPAPSSSATIVLSIRQRAAFDTSRVLVVSTDGSL